MQKFNKRLKKLDSGCSLLKVADGVWSRERREGGEVSQFFNHQGTKAGCWAWQLVGRRWRRCGARPNQTRPNQTKPDRKQQKSEIWELKPEFTKGAKRARPTRATHNGRRDKIRMSKNGHARRTETPPAAGKAAPEIPSAGERQNPSRAVEQSVYIHISTYMASEIIKNLCSEAPHHFCHLKFLVRNRRRKDANTAKQVIFSSRNTQKK